MKLNIGLTQEDVKRLVLAELEMKLGSIPLKIENVKIEVRSKQNYKSEWEEAEYRVSYTIDFK